MELLNCHFRQILKGKMGVINPTTYNHIERSHEFFRNSEVDQEVSLDIWNDQMFKQRILINALT